MSFEIAVGGSVIPPENSENLTELTGLTEMEIFNWNNCVHKSEKMVYWMKSECGCGPGSNVEMVRCLKLDISNLNPVICSTCTFFLQKEEIQN